MNTDLYKFIEQSYTIGTVNNIEEINKGLLTKNFKVISSQGEYFLKQHREEVDESALYYIESVESFFSEHGIPVLKPITSLSKMNHFSFNGGVYTIYPYKGGYADIDRDKINDNCIISMASMLARMHRVGSNSDKLFQSKFDKFWNTDKALSKLRDIRTIIRPSTAFDELAIKMIDLKIDYLENNKLLSAVELVKNDTLIHGDYHDQNLFFSKDDKIDWIFDFEKSGYGSGVFELVRSVLLVCFNHNFDHDNFRKAALYLNTYNQYNKLSLSDIQNSTRAFILKSMHSTWIESEHYLKQNYILDDLLEKQFSNLLYFKQNENFALDLIAI
jgi:Ser/Thr protein kinase RdoA (MazF antagonist)